MSYVTALVIQQTNTVFISPAGIGVTKSGANVLLSGFGLQTVIPTPDIGAVIDGDYWAVPVTEGVLTGWQFLPYNLNDATQNVAPPMSFAVTRIWDRFLTDDWYFVGTTSQYVTAASGGSALPLNIGNNVFESACQPLCQWNANSLYFGKLGVPFQTGNSNLYPYGFWNGIALPLATAAGYSNTTTLLTFLNTATTTVITNGVISSYTGGWAVVGTWSVDSNGGLNVTESTAAVGTDVLCAAIGLVNPSN